MDRKKFKKMFVTMVLIGAFLMIGTGIKTARADGNIDSSAMYCAFSGYYQGLGEYFAAYALNYGGPDYMWDSYLYLDGSKAYAYNAYYDALYSSVYYAYEAYTFAYEAYLALDYAAYYAYYSYLYGYSEDAFLSLLNAGAGAYYIAYASYYAGVLY